MKRPATAGPVLRSQPFSANNPMQPTQQQQSQPSAITVAVRVRPLSKKEIESGLQPCCAVLQDRVVAIRKCADGMNHLRSQMGSLHEYGFDYAFDESASQSEVYLKTTKPCLASLLAGLNVTVFAYGATGAGMIFYPISLVLLFCLF